VTRRLSHACRKAGSGRGDHLVGDQAGAALLGGGVLDRSLQEPKGAAESDSQHQGADHRREPARGGGQVGRGQPSGHPEPPLTQAQTSAESAVVTVIQLSVPIALLVGLVRIRRSRSAVADLVVALGRAPGPAGVRQALATALGDPSLTVC
jgi:hypothetical protein